MIFQRKMVIINFIILAALVTRAATLCPVDCLCPDTQIVNCSGVGRDQLPVGDFSGVLILDFSRNKLTELTKNMNSLELIELQKADFSYNNIGEVEMQSFDKSAKLMFLDLSWNKLITFGRLTLRHTVHINNLSLAGNPSLFKEEGRFSLKSNTLQQLNLSNCEIGSIPNGKFEEVELLRSLDLSHNRLTKLRPEAFSNLSHLERLDLSYNHLDAEQLHVLTNRLGNATIITGPQRVSPCSWSTDDLANCSHQGLTELLPVRFNNFTHHVDLSYNKLTNLTRESVNTLRGVQHLYSLNFSHNLIYNIDEDALADGLWLKDVDLSWNRLSSIRPTTFQHNYYIERLSLAGNVEFILDPYENFKNAWHLKHLNLSQCSLTDIPNKSFKNVYHLQSLDVSHNELITLHSESFFGINTLEILDLSNNQIDNIGSGVLSQLFKLKCLDLSYNQLTTLNTFAVSLNSLNTLDIRYNKFETLEIALLMELFKDVKSSDQDAAKIELETVTKSSNNKNSSKGLASPLSPLGVTIMILSVILI